MEGNQKGNIQSIQFLRGIAAFLVMLTHSEAASAFGKEGWFVSFCYSGWMGVNIFFIISGFIMPYSMFQSRYKHSDIGQFFLKRFTRIEPPYIVSIVLVLLLNWSNTLTPWYHGPAFKVDWWNTLGHLGYLNAFTGSPWLNLAYWTLAIEFEYYILLAIFYPMMTSEVKWKKWGVLMLLLGSVFLQMPDNKLVPGVHILAYLPFFVAGIALFMYQKKMVSVVEFLVLATTCLTMILLMHSLILCIISVATLLAIHFIKSVPKALLWLGTISYSLYLTHNVITARYMALGKRFLHGVDPRFIWVSELLFCILVAWVYFQFVEKPFIRLSKRIIFRRADKVRAAEVTSRLLEVQD